MKIKTRFPYLPVAFTFALACNIAAFAQTKPCPTAVPCNTHTAAEIDSALIVSAFAFLGGAIAVVRARRRK